MDAHRIGVVALMACLAATVSAQAAQKDLVVASGGKCSAAIVVSQYYHLPRARLALARAGVRSVFSAHAEVVLTWREPYTLFREFVAYYYYLLRTF